MGTPNADRPGNAPVDQSTLRRPLDQRRPRTLLI
jgi:hypothetical protein